MIINDHQLFELAPIKNMLSTKERFNGVSYGLTEAGYDIRLKQDISFDFYDEKIYWNVRDTGGKFSEGIGRFVIASAIEEFQMPENLVGVVHDKSTWARKGLSVFNTVIEPGWKGFLTLELVYHGNDLLRLPAGSGIAQVLFSEVSLAASYSGKYQSQPDRPVEAIFEES